jgi:hypothetical protein
VRRCFEIEAYVVKGIVNTTKQNSGNQTHQALLDRGFTAQLNESTKNSATAATIVHSNGDRPAEVGLTGEDLVASLPPELQMLRQAIVSDITTAFRGFRNPSRPITDPRKRAIAELLRARPKITTLQVCREMDKRQEHSSVYAPLPSWMRRLWVEAYRNAQLKNRVESYVSCVRSSLR